MLIIFAFLLKINQSKSMFKRSHHQVIWNYLLQQICLMNIYIYANDTTVRYKNQLTYFMLLQHLFSFGASTVSNLQIDPLWVEVRLTSSLSVENWLALWTVCFLSCVLCVQLKSKEIEEASRPSYGMRMSAVKPRLVKRRMYTLHILLSSL